MTCDRLRVGNWFPELETADVVLRSARSANARLFFSSSDHLGVEIKGKTHCVGVLHEETGDNYKRKRLAGETERALLEPHPRLPSGAGLPSRGRASNVA